MSVEAIYGYRPGVRGWCRRRSRWPGWTQDTEIGCDLLQKRRFALADSRVGIIPGLLRAGLGANTNLSMRRTLGVGFQPNPGGSRFIFTRRPTIVFHSLRLIRSSEHNALGHETSAGNRSIIQRTDRRTSIFALNGTQARGRTAFDRRWSTEGNPL